MEYTEFAKTEFHPDGTASVKLIFADGSHKWKLFDSKRKAIEYIKSNGFIQVKRVLQKKLQKTSSSWFTKARDLLYNVFVRKKGKSREARRQEDEERKGVFLPEQGNGLCEQCHRNGRRGSQGHVFQRRVRSDSVPCLLVLKQNF